MGVTALYRVLLGSNTLLGDWLKSGDKKYEHIHGYLRLGLHAQSLSEGTFLDIGFEISDNALNALMYDIITTVNAYVESHFIGETLKNTPETAFLQFVLTEKLWYAFAVHEKNANPLLSKKTNGSC